VSFLIPAARMTPFSFISLLFHLRSQWKRREEEHYHSLLLLSLLQLLLHSLRQVPQPGSPALPAPHILQCNFTFGRFGGVWRWSELCAPVFSLRCPASWPRGRSAVSRTRPVTTRLGEGAVSPPPTTCNSLLGAC